MGNRLNVCYSLADTRVMVTGATGFVGKEICKIIPNPIRVVRRLNQIKSDRDILILRINGSTNWDNSLCDIDTVIHLAGLAHHNSYTCAEYRAVNTDGTLKLAKKAAEAGVRRFVFVSSIGVNGRATRERCFTHDQAVNPHNSYAKSKYNAEVGLRKIAHDTGLEVVIVRPTLVYGPGAPGNFGSLTKLVSKSPFLPFGLANNKRDFVSVQNLADLLVTCVVHPDAAGHTFLARDGETVSIKEFTNAIATGLGKRIVQVPIPVCLMRLAGGLTGKSTMIEQLYGNLEVDSSNIKEVLGWVPPYTMKQVMALLSEKKI